LRTSGGGRVGGRTFSAPYDLGADGGQVAEGDDRDGDREAALGSSPPCDSSAHLRQRGASWRNAKSATPWALTHGGGGFPGVYFGPNGLRRPRGLPPILPLRLRLVPSLPPSSAAAARGAFGPAPTADGWPSSWRTTSACRKIARRPAGAVARAHGRGQPGAGPSPPSCGLGAVDGPRVDFSTSGGDSKLQRLSGRNIGGPLGGERADTTISRCAYYAPPGSLHRASRAMTASTLVASTTSAPVS